MFKFLKTLCTPKCFLAVTLLALGLLCYIYCEDISFGISSPLREGLQSAPLAPTDVLAGAAPVSLPAATETNPAKALLPKDPNTGWAIMHPSTDGNKAMNPDLFQYGKDWGVNSIVVPRRNANVTGRIDPVIARVDTGPWMQAPDRERDPYQGGYELEPVPIPGYKS